MRTFFGISINTLSLPIYLFPKLNLDISHSPLMHVEKFSSMRQFKKKKKKSLGTTCVYM